MSYKIAFRDVMRAYEADRDHAATVLKKRLEEVYGKLPQVQEIDNKLAQVGIDTAKRILSEEGASQTLLHDLRTKTLALKEEKERLFADNGIPKGYFTDIFKCSLCQDTGYAENIRCGCLKQRLIDKYYDLSNVRGLLEEENFDTFDFKYYSQNVNPAQGLSPYRNMQIIYKTALNFVQEFGCRGRKIQNLLFYGDTGLGKTFLCNCIAKDLLDAGYTVLYVTAPQIFKLVEEHRFNRDEEEEPNYAIDAVTDVDLLILDDLGAEFSTIVTSAALFNIINQRLLAKKPTVISSNLSPAELEAQYSDRIVSRFLGNYKMSKFYGDDIRAKKKYERN